MLDNTLKIIIENMSEYESCFALYKEHRIMRDIRRKVFLLLLDEQQNIKEEITEIVEGFFTRFFYRKKLRDLYDKLNNNYFKLNFWHEDSWFESYALQNEIEKARNAVDTKCYNDALRVEFRCDYDFSTRFMNNATSSVTF